MYEAAYHMTETVQWTTLVMVAGVVALILMGIWAIIADVRDTESIETIEAEIKDLADDLCLGRDSHFIHLGGWKYEDN